MLSPISLCTCLTCCRCTGHDCACVLQKVHIFCEWWTEKKFGRDAAGIVQRMQIHKIDPSKSSLQLCKLGHDVLSLANGNFEKGVGKLFPYLSLHCTACGYIACLTLQCHAQCHELSLPDTLSNVLLQLGTYNALIGDQALFCSSKMCRSLWLFFSICVQYTCLIGV